MFRRALAGGLALVRVYMAALIASPAYAGESPIHFLLGQSKLHPLSTFAASSEGRAAGVGQVVRASWYGGGEYLNARTSTGEHFDPRGHTAVHRWLPFGTRLEIVNLANGRATIVRVNDRGPAFWTGRALDLSRAAAADLGMIGAGEARVSYRIIN